jgi:hypothetical protein
MTTGSLTGCERLNTYLLIAWRQRAYDLDSLVADVEVQIVVSRQHPVAPPLQHRPASAGAVFAKPLSSTLTGLPVEHLLVVAAAAPLTRSGSGT